MFYFHRSSFFMDCLIFTFWIAFFFLTIQIKLVIIGFLLSIIHICIFTFPRHLIIKYFLVKYPQRFKTISPFVAISSSICFISFQLVIGFAEFFILSRFIINSKVKIIFMLLCALFVTFAVMSILCYGFGVSMS